MENEYVLFEEYSKLKPESRSLDPRLVYNRFGERTWGIDGAGILIVSEDLKKILLLKRSEDVVDPFLWGISGGARKETSSGLEGALITALFETKEEIGSIPKGKIRKKPYLYERPGTNFSYRTFILEMDKEERKSFTPKLNWEHTDYLWVKRKDAGKMKLHPGVRNLLKNYEF